MRIPRPGLSLSLLIGFGTGVLVVPLALLVFNLRAEQALLAGGIGAASAAVVAFPLLHLLMVRRVDGLYEKLLTIKKRRLPDYPVYRSSDPIHGISRTVLELTGTFRQELADLREAELVRKEFIGDISHELKTPIFAIQGFIETLLDGALEDEAVNRVFLQKALNNSERLSNLVKDLLTVSQLEAGHLQMNLEPFRLYELVLDVLSTLEYKASAKGRDIRLEVEPRVEEKVYVLADKERIRQVLNNLVDNGIKYGAKAGAVRVIIDEEAEQEDKVVVSVTNQGNGIPPEDQPHIFDRFYRVEKSRARNLGGNGLGLSIVKNLIDAHNEKIWVDSNNQLTSFSFTLPVTRG